MPRIDPTALRDHATDERVARVWARIDQDLDIREPASPRRAGFAAALLAATMAAFGGGILCGRLMEPAGEAAQLEALPSQDQRAANEIIAAGTSERTYPLPGGGAISLAPGSTIELERAEGGALKLRLVQGEAAIDTVGVTRSGEIALVAGEAQVSTAAAGSFRVRHNVDDIDIDVSDGSVRVTSPVGSRDLGRGDSAAGVPIRQRTTTLVAPPPTSSPVLRNAPPAPSVAEVPSVEPAPVAVAAPDWRARFNAGDDSGALDMLRQQGGGIDGAIASARTAKELMELNDLLRGRGGDQAAAIRALSRVVDAFPGDPNAEIAAFTLGNLYARAGDQAKAAKYYERAGNLSPGGNLAEDSFCKRIGAEVLAGHKEEAIRMAQEYVSKYPDGRCEAVQRINAGEKADEAEVVEERDVEPAPAPAQRDTASPSPDAPAPAP
ncbi:hypothetical protein CAP_7225 [Chondromyces apiculatus DSM 436]|uniref:FecR protein domain-containing protein n=1 Tax=Chondromyces apiculatus DSM 436 TaxID=1192034 RepID=A0A017T151_9BACT|nr:hypothetical protein CAP_7225 [Chondromyces apiculatus DSM 436]